jgi:hypothetical protein
MTDESQILYITEDFEKADLVLRRWEASHAASAWIVECTEVQGFGGWRPIIPPNSDLEWAEENFIEKAN